jgi:hypothetical protein
MVTSEGDKKLRIDELCAHLASYLARILPFPSFWFVGALYVA